MAIVKKSKGGGRKCPSRQGAEEVQKREKPLVHPEQVKHKKGMWFEERERKKKD